MIRQIYHDGIFVTKEVNDVPHNEVVIVSGIVIICYILFLRIVNIRFLSLFVTDSKPLILTTVRITVGCINMLPPKMKNH